jgi:hypothetical protein
MGEVVSGQSASFYMTTGPRRARRAPRLAGYFQPGSEISMSTSSVSRLARPMLLGAIKP